MKKILSIIIAFGFPILLSAQSTFESYLKRTPALPHDSCNISKNEAENFKQQVTAIIAELDNDIENRNRAISQYSDDNEELMKNNVVNQMQQQYNMSDEDVAKMKEGDKLSDEETEALANKMIMQQTNMTLEEAKNLSNMSEAGRQAYAEAYYTEAMATQGAQSQTNVNSSTMNTYQLNSEQQTVRNKIMAETQRINNQYAAIDNDPSGKTMTDKISQWNSKLVSMMGIVSDKDAKTMDSLGLLIQKEQIKYCDKFTPKYRAVLRQDLANLKALLPDYRRLDEITGEMMKVQTGVAPAPESKDISSLKALLAYLNNLEDAYQYKLYYTDNN
jgi:hypothetical protein